ncbi:TetR/AcrR family transcriptional regulator [Paenibacillus sp. KN14-4R]|uniref:TetR/AcrR family transcriptional regulator n=1 Tax=Paenibacillus sp. KN14-4R TaxID=3445773 RepID=UPI003F9F773E
MTSSKKKEKYDLILDAALKVFAEHGFHRAQVAKIAREAGVADGTIYLYFKRKEDILICLFREQLGKLLQLANEAIRDISDVKTALRTICEIHYTHLESNLDLAFVTQIELRQSSLELRKEIGIAYKPYIKLVEDLLNRGIAQNVFRPDMNVKLVRLLILGAIDEVVTSWLIAGQKYSLAAQVDGTVDFFLKGIESS